MKIQPICTWPWCFRWTAGLGAIILILVPAALLTVMYSAARAAITDIAESDVWLILASAFYITFYGDRED